MSDELRDLFQEVLLDHYRRPRRRGALENATHRAHGDNPLCGDRVSLAVRLGTDGRVEQARFEGSGCAISTAAASIMAETVEGMSVPEIEALYERYRRIVTGDEPAPAAGDESLGKLRVFAGVREFPSRVKCATLPWHALRAALEAGAVPPTVTTESPESSNLAGGSV